SMTDRNGRLTQFVYDNLNRQTQEKWMQGGSAIRTITSAYDAGGRLISSSDPDSAWTYSYDALDRLISSDNNGTPNLLRAVLTNVYDPAGNRTSLAISMAGSNIFTNTYTYDALNRLKIVNQSGTGVSSKSAKYDYDAASDVLKLTRYKDTTQ